MKLDEKNNLLKKGGTVRIIDRKSERERNGMNLLSNCEMM